MSIGDPEKQKIIYKETLKKISELLPSVRLEQPPIKKTLIIIGGTAKARTVVLLAEELNKHFNTKIDIITFYSEQSKVSDEVTKESFEDSLAFTHEHLRSDDFEIIGSVVENTEMLKISLDNAFKNTNYDLIIIPYSFICMKEVHMKEEEIEETEA